MPKINKRNYHKPNNRALTNSKCIDFEKDKFFFKQKHLDSTRVIPITDALIIGSAVDAYVTKGKKYFDLTYKIVSRRTKDANDYKYQLNETLYNEVVSISESVLRQKANKELGGYKSQKIFQYEMPLGEHFDRILAMSDWVKIKDGVCTITDLKTSSTIDPVKYHYHCLDFSYYRQAAWFRYVIGKCHPEITEFYHFHLVVEKDRDDIYNCQTFQLAESRIVRELAKIEALIPQIAAEKEFKPNDTSFSNAILIGEILEDL